MRILLKLAVNAAALWVAAWLVDGIHLEEGFLTILLVAAVFALVNTFIRPIAKFISLPLLILSLGLFTFVINTAMLGLTAWILPDLTIDGFWSAFLGALVITVVSAVLNWILPNED
jgi:putative membrane protein